MSAGCRIRKIPFRDERRRLYQRNAPGIHYTSAGSRNRVGEPRRDELGRLELKARRNHACYRNIEARSGQVEAKGLDTEMRQTLHDAIQRGTRIGCTKAWMPCALTRRLQHYAMVRVDHGGSPPMHAVALVECVFPALTAFRFDHRLGKFNLTHLQDGGARRGRERRSRRQSKSKSESIGRAREGGDAGYTDVRRNIE